MISTVQAQPTLPRGSIAIRSQSGLLLLTGNDYSELHRIFLRVLGTLPFYSFQTHLMDFQTSMTWLYLTNTGAVQEFSLYHTALLEQTYRMGGTRIALDSVSTVYFTPMIRLYQTGSWEAVARLEKAVSTSDAAVMEVNCDLESFNVLSQELRKIEQEEALRKHLPGEVLKLLCSQFGLSIKNNVLIGTEYCLTQARLFLKTDNSFIFSSVECSPIPGNFPIQFLTQMAEMYQVVAFNSYFIGQSTDICTLLTILNDEYASVPCPPGLSYQEVVETCSVFGSVYCNEAISGTKEAVNNTLMRLTLHQAFAPLDADPSGLLSLPSHVNVTVEGNVIKGSKENVQTALQLVRRKKEKVRYPVGTPKQTIEQVAQKYHLLVEDMCFIGDQHSIVQALDELNRSPIQLGFQYHSYPDWYQTQTTEMEKKTLSSLSREYKLVETQFNQSIHGCGAIVGIEQVQNRRLYTNFAYKHEAFSKVEGRCIEIKLLFHGTRGTDPSVIFQSDLGLDSRLGKGWWGAGTYYAESADYSHAYCHRTAAGQCQMFLCSVITGDSIELPPDHSLVRPPEKNGSKFCYHSVKGSDQGTYQWITYEAAMSYPTYLITYQ